jgi:hypothetical protein
VKDGKARFQRMVEADTVMKNYAVVLEMLLRMRLKHLSLEEGVRIL